MTSHINQAITLQGLAYQMLMRDEVKTQSRIGIIFQSLEYKQKWRGSWLQVKKKKALN